MRQIMMPLALLAFVACGGGELNTDSGNTSDLDSDTDTDTDTDSDTDADTDTDTDSDTDADTDSDTDADTDSDTDVDVGDPVADPSGLDGNDYVAPWSTVKWVKPGATTADLLQDYIPIDYFLFEVVKVASDESTLDFAAALGEEASAGGPQQMACYNVISQPGLDFGDNPIFESSGADLTIPAGGYDLTIENFKVWGWFADDGSAINDMTLTGQVDTRPLDTALGQDVCTIIGFLGETCVACADTAVECIDMELYAEEVPLSTTFELDENYDPASDSGC